MTTTLQPATPDSNPPPLQNPIPYPSHRTPTMSLLRPHVPAKERLLKWTPKRNTTTSQQSSSRPDDPAQANREGRIGEGDTLEAFLVKAYGDSTAAVYGSGLLAFHVFCDAREIREEE